MHESGYVILLHLVMMEDFYLFIYFYCTDVVHRSKGTLIHVKFTMPKQRATVLFFFRSFFPTTSLHKDRGGIPLTYRMLDCSAESGGI